MKTKKNPVYFIIFIYILATVFSAMYNATLFHNDYPPEYFMTTMLISIVQNAIIWYIVLLNRWVGVIVAPILFGIGAAFNFYIVNFQIGLQIEYMTMFFDTNLKEATGMINSELIISVIIGIVIGLAFAMVRFKFMGKLSWKIMTALLILLIIPIVVSKYPEKGLKEVRLHNKGANTGRGFAAMPEKYLENIYHFIRNTSKMSAKLAARKAMAPPEVEYNGADNLTVVFILTDALRPDHMQINGYGRETTPNMIKLDFEMFNDMYACETSTNLAVQCLVTRASRKDISKSLSEESIITMFKAAGFYTAWISGQGSLNTADREPTILANDADYQYFYQDVNKISGNTYDSHLLPELDKALASDNPKKFVILHLNGSHWEYYSRYNDSQRKYTPDCNKWIYDCTLDEVINAYDNTIVATDELVADIAERLKDKNAVIYFSSDHGQFLGEHGKRIHGHNLLQYKEVSVVPFGIWASSKFKLPDAVKKNKEKITTHDTLFHSITDCSGLTSNLIDKSLSACSDNLTDTPPEY